MALAFTLIVNVIARIDYLSSHLSQVSHMHTNEAKGATTGEFNSSYVLAWPYA
jgi:hypothetical protein